MIALACLIAWLLASALVGWLAGRFIRVGMVELQPGDHAQREALTQER
jgi:hypothetical protein